MQERQLRRGLYVITDYRETAFADLYRKTEIILQKGISILQYRNKTASRQERQSEATELGKLCRGYDTCFIINDDLDLAVDLDADGVHLGSGDVSCATARKQLGQQKLIGISCYNEMERATRAVEDGADYIAFGAMYPTMGKKDAKQASPELIRAAKQTFTIPVVAIGGITPDNCLPLLAAGADMLAVIGSVYHADNPAEITEHFNRLIIKDELI